MRRTLCARRAGSLPRRAGPLSPGCRSSRPPPRPEEAAAVVAALERFLRETTPVVAAEPPRMSPWQRAALLEGVGREPASRRPGATPTPGSAARLPAPAGSQILAGMARAVHRLGAPVLASLALTVASLSGLPPTGTPADLDAAHAAKEPKRATVYRTKGYKGLRVAPKVGPEQAPPSVGLGAGEQPDVLVDAAGRRTSSSPRRVPREAATPPATAGSRAAPPPATTRTARRSAAPRRRSPRTSPGRRSCRSATGSSR